MPIGQPGIRWTVVVPRAVRLARCASDAGRARLRTAAIVGGRSRLTLVGAVLAAALVMAATGGAPASFAAAGTSQRPNVAQPAGVHPQTFIDQAGLARLRAQRTGDHKWLADILQRFLDRYASSPVGISGVGGYAIGAEIFQNPAYVAAATRSLNAMGSGPRDRDLQESEYLRNLAEGYDILANDLSAGDRDQARSRLANAAADMADAINGGIWWADDFTNNHNWVNVGALGLAGYALRGEDPRADAWIQMALANQAKDAIVGNAVTDGSWHEGVGYQDFMLATQIPFYLAAHLQGTEIGDTAMLRNYGRFALYDMIPGHTRQQVVSNGDWVWSRPGHAAMLSYVAARYRDQVAQAAAAAWEQDQTALTQRFGSYEFIESPALQYVAYDASVPAAELDALPRDYYAADLQTAFQRTGFGAGDLALGFKNGVFGGRGIFDRYQAGQGASSYINFGHDHVDDLSLFLSGRGGWYLPEAASYNCCTDVDSDYTTAWHNSLLFDGTGQLGDNRNSTGQDTSTGAPWFFTRDAAMPLHASTAHYSFARGDGTRLYPSSLGISSLQRTTVMSRDSGYVMLHDRAAMSGTRRVDQVFHAQQSMTTATPGWVLGTNEDDRLLGIRVLAPSSVGSDLGTQQSGNLNYYYSYDNDGKYAYARIHPTSNTQNVTFLDVLWPTNSPGWAARPNIQPLDGGHPEAGASVPLTGATERWVYATGASTTAGGLTLTGATIGIARLDEAGNVQRLAIEGNGTLADTAHTLLATPAPGVVEVNIAGTTAEVTGTLADGVRFYGPATTQVTVNGQPAQFSRNADGTVTVGTTTPPSTVEVTAPGPGSTVTATITLAATAASPDGIASVQFLADGQPAGPEDTTAPYSLPFDTTALLDGTHTFTARARTTSGMTATSAPVTVTVQNPHGTCLTATAGQPWPATGFASQNGRFTATWEMTAADASTDAGVGLGHGPATRWTDLATIVVFSSADTTLNHTIAARDGDHYVSSGLTWTPNQTYQIRLVIDVGAHTYHAYVRAPGATTDTPIGDTLAFRTEQQTVTTLDTMTVAAAIGSDRACGLVTAMG
jgi:hypothetical protein